MKNILEKSGNFVRGKKWEPCVVLLVCKNEKSDVSVSFHAVLRYRAENNTRPVVNDD